MTKGSKVDKGGEPFREKVELIFHSGSVATNSIAAVLGKERRGERMPAAMSSAATADGISAGGILGYCRQSANTVRWIGRGGHLPHFSPAHSPSQYHPPPPHSMECFISSQELMSILLQIYSSSSEDNSHGHIGSIWSC